jgi:DNA gyrase subunit A
LSETDNKETNVGRALDGFIANIGQVVEQDIAERTAYSFLSYASYAIGDRALPRVNDGLKPVHRRILYSMHGLGLRPNGAFKKSARTVGDVLGKYHPHGDTSVYDAMVGMAQDFNMRYPLVHGHGNFGNVDGDTAAAMRYTEAKLSPVGELMLRDIEKDTVEMQPNFDDSEAEPVVLPTLFPALLCNGTMGIAVGMATSMPPHNATDVYKALDRVLEDALNGEETSIETLIGIIKAPDFPTGAQIIDLKGIHEGYRTGKGRVVIRSKFTVEEEKGRQQIIITEIPYKVNKATLHIQIDEMRKNSLEDIKEVRDESDKDGIRLVIELKKDANVQWVIKKLLKHTQMQDSYSMNHVALVDGKPVEKLTLKDLIEHYLAHVADVVRRRTAFDLNKAEKRAHVVEGIISCLDRMDEIITVIRSSRPQSAVVPNLMSSFELSEPQAQAIADMRLARLSGASAEDYQAELDKLVGDITKWTEIINDEGALLTAVRADLHEVSQMFTDGRLTEIAVVSGETDDERDLIKDETLVITYTNKGLIKSVSETEYTAMGRRNKGTKSATMKEDDSVRTMLTVNSKDDILFLTNQGRCHVLAAFKLPVSSRTTAGKYINNYLNLEAEEKIISILSVSPTLADTDLLFVTKNGIGKRLELTNLSRRLSVTKIMSFKDGDELVSCTLVKAGQDVIVVTSGGQGVRFELDDEKKGIRPMGRSAAGVILIKLRKHDRVVDVLVLDGSDTFLVMSEYGYAKRCAFKDFPSQSRGIQGVKVLPVTEKTGLIVSAMTVQENDDLFIASRNGQLSRTLVSEIPTMGRPALGVLTMGLKDDDVVVSISKNTGEADDVQ